MNLNPFTAIEKFITEHGSAAVLEKHLALIRDQLADAERKVVESGQAVIKANDSTTLAEQRLAQAESRILELQKQLDDSTKADDVMNEEEAKILKFFFQEQESSCPSASAILRIPIPNVTHHVGSLLNRGFLRPSRGSAGPNRPAMCRITHEGSAQAMKNV